MLLFLYYQILDTAIKISPARPRVYFMLFMTTYCIHNAVQVTEADSDYLTPSAWKLVGKMLHTQAPTKQIRMQES